MCRRGDTKSVFALAADIIERGVRVERDAWSRVISACEREGDWSRALAVVSAMTKTGLNLDEAMYCSLVRAADLTNKVK